MCGPGGLGTQLEENATGPPSDHLDRSPCRPHGLFPPGDALLQRLAATPGCWPFEKHLPGKASPYELLPKGGWITGDASAARGVDLRMFYQEPGAGAVGTEACTTPWGSVVAAVRFGEGAGIGEGFFLTAHGGAVRHGGAAAGGALPCLALPCLDCHAHFRGQAPTSLPIMCAGVPQAVL